MSGKEDMEETKEGVKRHVKVGRERILSESMLEKWVNKKRRLRINQWEVKKRMFSRKTRR